jgi:hypothetical protein
MSHNKLSDVSDLVQENLGCETDDLTTRHMLGARGGSMLKVLPSFVLAQQTIFGGPLQKMALERATLVWMLSNTGVPVC